MSSVYKEISTSEIYSYVLERMMTKDSFISWWNIDKGRTEWWDYRDKKVSYCYWGDEAWETRHDDAFG